MRLWHQPVLQALSGHYPIPATFSKLDEQSFGMTALVTSSEMQELQPLQLLKTASNIHFFRYFQGVVHINSKTRICLQRSKKSLTCPLISILLMHAPCRLCRATNAVCPIAAILRLSERLKYGDSRAGLGSESPSGCAFMSALVNPARC